MTEEAALLKAITANPDEDTPRLVFADWLDENKPDEKPSTASSPSARAEYIRTQCRLAAGAFDDPDYPELLEQERDLADWLHAHDPDSLPPLEGLFDFRTFGAGQWAEYRRGFPEVMAFHDYGDLPEETVERLVKALADVFPRTPARSIALEDAKAEEIARLVESPVFGKLRGLYLDYLSEGEEHEAAAAIATSPHSAGLRRLYLDLPLDVDGCRALAASKYLGNLESLILAYPSPASGLKELAGARWFRNLRWLGFSNNIGDMFRVVGSLPPMPQLLSLSLSGSSATSSATIKRFVASESFPRLAHLNLSDARLQSEHIALLARGEWPLQHLELSQNEVRKAGAEALTKAPFASTLRVLELRECDITAGGVQALGESESLAGLRHLDLHANPIGSGGLQALAASRYLRNLRSLTLGATNTARGPIAARDVYEFLSAFDTSELRHLTLDSLPVAVRGARVLATSPAFANLTRLRLESCGLGERGTKELLGSKILGNLVVLALSGNTLGAAAGKLASPKVFPHLARCYLGYGMPKATATRIRRRVGMEG
jgi:uncharacterized protein (TIGR02996 family)